MVMVMNMVMSGKSKQVAAGEFKARCLSLMENVNRLNLEYVITKRGKPVAKLVPVLTRQIVPFVGRSKGEIQVSGDLLAPDAEDWDVDADF